MNPGAANIISFLSEAGAGAIGGRKMMGSWGFGVCGRKQTCPMIVISQVSELARL